VADLDIDELVFDLLRLKQRLDALAFPALAHDLCAGDGPRGPSLGRFTLAPLCPHRFLARRSRTLLHEIADQAFLRQALGSGLDVLHPLFVHTVYRFFDQVADDGLDIAADITRL